MLIMAVALVPQLTRSWAPRKTLIKCIVAELQSSAVFNVRPGRHHSSFSVPRVPLHTKPETELIDWMAAHIQFS